jgi:hypothetical protein
MFVATAKRLRVLKSSDLPASSVSPRHAEFLTPSFLLSSSVQPNI